MEKALKSLANLQLLCLVLAALWWCFLPYEEWELMAPVVAADGRHAARLKRFSWEGMLIKYTSYEIEVTPEYLEGEWRTAIEYLTGPDDASLSWPDTNRLQVVICERCENTQVADSVAGISITVLKPDGSKPSKMIKSNKH